MKSLTSSSLATTSSQDKFKPLPSSWVSTYSREYTGTFGQPAPNARVRTSRFYPTGQPRVDSTYRSHFPCHQSNPRIKIPYGTSSGYRNNNPHPHNMKQVFNHPSKAEYFVWSRCLKLPPLCQKMCMDKGSSSSELLKKVCQDKTRSIYQEDYVPPL
ncbi:uncharacterized protein LOC122959433 [Acropora millepora]|uniref:uncharacterized protein LOC122959433 n=1 Tax=Acropora millepora TaxID=45264 RepID=UPI001CF51D0E|nr:uncharacterized protein LOC122959433 [Acropora millepora]